MNHIPPGIVCDRTKSKVENADPTCDKPDNRVGTKCTYKCTDKIPNKAFRLIGSGVKECRANGTWSGQDTACEGKSINIIIGKLVQVTDKASTVARLRI